MIDIRDFLKTIPRNGDTTPAVRLALEHCRKERLKKLVFPKGTYHFRPESAVERYLFISNNDEGLKRIAFPVFDFEDFEIDGQGSEFIFHGFILPFVFMGSHRVGLRNVRIDWARTFHNEARVLSVADGHVDVGIAEKFPYRIDDGRLTFTGEGNDTYEIRNILEFDSEKRETAFLVYDNYGIGERCRAEELAPGRVRLHADFAHPRPQPGNILALMDNRRECPAITIAKSSQVKLRGIDIHHAGAMGVIAQQSRDLSLRAVRVTPAPGSGRMISTTADATHFVNCAGHVEITDCLFENQMDDPVNVHGIYAKIESQPAPDAVQIRLKHVQQLGIDLAAPGDRVEFVHEKSLLTYHEGVVASVQRINKECSVLTFESPLPPAVRPGDAVANLTWTPDVTIRGTTARRNRARGFLLSTPGRIVVEDNVFHTPGSALLLAGDANYWFESGAVRDVTIRRNLFENCNYGVWGRAAIDIHPEVEKGLRSPYHRNITIEENTFVVFDRRILRAEGVDGLIIRDNEIRLSDSYPPQHGDAEPFHLEHCAHVELDEENAVLAAEAR